MGALAGGALSFLTVSATAGSAGGAAAGSVAAVTGLALRAGSITPTASRDVALVWNVATLADGGSVGGYVVDRYDNSDAPQAVGASCSGVLTATSCTESSVPDGTWTYGAQAKFHNWLGAESARITVHVDTSAPAVTAHPTSISANAGPSIAFSHATYTSFKCKLDSGTFSSCSSPDALSSLADGSHTVAVEAVDTAGVPTQPANYTWSVATAAPAITAEPAATSANASPSYGFSHSSYASFECNLDGAGYSSCTSPKSYSSLTNGPHTFQVRAKDADGVPTPAASYTWTINTTAPAISSKPSTPSASSAPSLAFSHTAGAYTFKCQLDGGSFATCSSPQALSALGDGSHTFQVEGVDADGIVTSAASYTWTINTAAPTLTAQPANPTAQTNGTFTFTDGTYSQFTCKLDSGSASACNTGTAAYAGPLAAGSHTFTVLARDADGAQTPTRSYTWTIDTTAPVLQTLQMFDNDHNGKVDHIVATFDESLGGCAAPCTSGWTLSSIPSGGTLTSVTVSGTTATLNLTEGAGAANTAVGSFTVALAATSGIADSVGNHASFAAQAPADKAAPVPIALVLGNGSGTVGAGDTASVTFSEPLAVASVCSTWSGNGANQTVAGNGNVLVTVSDGGAASDTLSSVTASTSCGGVVHFGTVGLGSASWVSATTTFSGNGSSKSQVDWTVATSSLKVTLGSPSATGGTVSGSVSATFTPDAAITDAAGNGVAGSVTATTKF
jgi:hypothetical protein